MGNGFVILVADRNRHVREFLQRELEEEGYSVRLATNCPEVLKIIEADDPPHLLVLDLEIPHTEGLALLEKLRDRDRVLPVVIHSFLPDFMDTWDGQQLVSAFVEKGADTESLKIAVGAMLRMCYHKQFASEDDPAPKRQSR